MDDKLSSNIQATSGAMILGGSRLEQDFIGCTMLRCNTNNSVLTIDTSSQLDKQRWNEMPSVAAFPRLESLILGNSRYIRSLHESISTLEYLRELSLISCLSLEALDPSISGLQSLQVVNNDNDEATTLTHKAIDHSSI